ncbi:MAG: DUF4405 domain-containing protein [Vicinamibacterales bacterium]
MAAKREPFYWRAFVTFYVVFSFVVIALSGIVLFVSPPGRIANWSVWRMTGLDKADWQAVHTIIAFLFVVAAAFHIYFNWRVILGYLRKRLNEGMRRKRELGASMGVMLILVVSTIAGAPPFGTVMDLGEDVKNSWGDSSSEPPVPHAELWTVEKFSETTRIPVEKAVDNLRRSGIEGFDPKKTTLAEIAEAHHLTPQAVYQRARADASVAPVPLAEGGGYGRKTVEDIANQLGIPVETAVERLKANGITAAERGDNIRELAERHGKRPIEIADLIQKQERN